MITFKTCWACSWTCLQPYLPRSYVSPYSPTKAKQFRGKSYHLKVLLSILKNHRLTFWQTFLVADLIQAPVKLLQGLLCQMNSSTSSYKIKLIILRHVSQAWRLLTSVDGNILINMIFFLISMTIIHLHFLVLEKPDSVFSFPTGVLSKANCSKLDRTCKKNRF